MAKKNWIKGAIKRPGAFKVKAKKAGKSTDAFKKSVLDNPGKYSPRTVKQANLANTLSKFNTGGNAYALPTSAGATTSNMMGLGDPMVAQNNLAQSNQALMQQQQLLTAQTEKRAEDLKQQSEEEFNAARNQYGSAVTKGLGKAIGTAGDTMRTAKYAKEAAQMTDGVTDVAGLLTNLGTAPVNAGKQGLQTMKGIGQGIATGVKSMGPVAGGSALGLAGAGIKKLSDDQDDTTLNFGETSGTLMQGAGTGLGLAGTLGALAPALAIPGIGWAAAGIGAGIAGIKALRNRNQARDFQEELDAKNLAKQEDLSMARDAAFQQNFTQTGANKGFNVGNSLTNSYIPSQQMMAKTGGLWDNIHAKRRRIAAGSGEKMRTPGSKGAPTDEALKRSQKEMGGERVPGGMIKPLPGGAVEFVGKKHEQGGILIDPQTEVEGGETMDNVKMSQGTDSEYIFSDHLRLGKKTFAERHKELVKRGASQTEIQRLARLQEAVANANGEQDRSPKAVQEYEDGGEKKRGPNPWRFSPEENWARQAQLSSNIDMEGIVGGTDYGNIGETAWGQYYSNFDKPEDWDAFYGDTYVPRVESYFQNNPEEAYQYLQEMYNSDDPNAENFKRKLTDSEGNMLPQEEALKVAQQLATDKKVGSFHMVLPQEIQPMTPIQAGPIPTTPKEEAPGESNAELPAAEKQKRNVPAWAAALPGLAGLMANNTKAKAMTTSAQTTRAGNLPRINLNAERAANQAQNIGTKRQLANQLSGPAGAAAMLAADQNARVQNLNITNQEARANEYLMAAEANMRAGVNAQNAAAVNQAGMYNADQLNRTNLENYQQDIINRRYNKGVLSGVARDAMQMYAGDRFAQMMDEFGAYNRATGQGKATPQEIAVAKAEAAGIDAAPISTPTPAAQQTTVSVPGQTLGAPGLLNTNTPIQGNPGFNPNVSTGIPLQPISNNPILNFNSPTTVGTSAIMPGLRNGGYISRANKLRRKPRR